MLFISCVLLAIVLWLGGLYLYSQRQRLNVNRFVMFLLLSDEVRAAQKQGFEDWLQQTPAISAQRLYQAADSAIERVAARLAAGDPNDAATSSILGVPALLWNYKERQQK